MHRGARLSEYGLSLAVGVTYCAGVAAMLASLGQIPEPKRPAFHIAGYATSVQPAGMAPAPLQRRGAPAVAVRSPAAPLPAQTPQDSGEPGPPDGDTGALVPESITQPMQGPSAALPGDRPGASDSGEAGGDVPPSPEDGPLPPPGIEPGGNTLVLAVLLDGMGTVLKTKILIPSGDAIANLTYGIALQSARDLQLNLDPPLQPDETRWLVVPITFRTGMEALP